MLMLSKPTVAIYVDRSNQQWIVRDTQGDFWVVPALPNGWEQRQPYTLTDDSDLIPIPAHYKYLLCLPF